MLAVVEEVLMEHLDQEELEDQVEVELEELQVLEQELEELLTQEVEVEVVAETVSPLGAPGGAGGSGIVIVRAPGSVGLAASPGTNTVTTLPAPAGGCKVATFTVSGDLTIS
jgi:hypothetical protein